MKKRKIVSLVLAAVMAAAALAGCSNEETGGGETASTGNAASDDSTFTVALELEPSSLDPIHNYAQDTMLCVNNIYDSLLDFNSDGEIVPMLASSWEMVDDVTYVYQIRDDVYFQDGTQMTVDDVVYSLTRYWDPSYAADTNWMYAAVESIEATGDWEVTVKLAYPDSSWQYIPATSAGQIVSKAYCEEKGDDFGTFTGGAMGTGAYGFESWTSGSELVLVKNEYYWNKDETLLFDKVVFKIIPDASSRALAVNSGQADMCMKLTSDELDQYDESVADIYSVKATNVNYAAFNTQRAPFDDANFRKAVACAIDTKAIREAVVGENGEDATSICFNDTMYTLDEDAWTAFADSIADDYSYDVDKAKEYLAQSAYPDGYDITYICLEGKSTVAQMVQSYLAELNINVTIVEAQASDWYAHAYGMILDENGARDYDMYEFIWYSDFPDPSATMLCLLWGMNAFEGGTNQAMYVNEEVDALFDAQTASTDLKERSEQLLDICEIVNDELPYINFYYENNNYVLNKKYTYELSPFWLFSYRIKDVEVK